MFRELTRKKPGYKKEFEYLEYIADKIKEIGHPARLQISEIIRKYKKICLDQLVNLIDLPENELADHLNILVKTGFVAETHENGRTCYVLRDPELMKLLKKIKLSGYFHS